MFEDAMEAVGKAMDAAGVAVIVVGVVAAGATSLWQLRRSTAAEVYRSLRQRVGRAILLGLEVLVAADIIRTVAVSPTLESAGSLAIIVAIRTALSFSLEVELEGHWPWQAQEQGRRPRTTPS
ncbi:DUF1622 domain-containing protein [Iamia sp. SCSIO 61187]|uniref:DUF1622 domain-containing protein n=1 Tax=Iamia sp. SCSIO 61187 TaxID=2722752 RepID=UPI001C633616|nr:DUF1622 domain-containing protein [Iamia sp. SCSIO 61187]QYG93191.1 DUF1622 domain-containing protein [Iamia sp. SCSIO 61187]